MLYSNLLIIYVFFNEESIKHYYLIQIVHSILIKVINYASKILFMV